ncbi:MAG TPA: hypothetical protein VIJ99_08920 [Acidimicrobiales bacterium]
MSAWAPGLGRYLLHHPLGTPTLVRAGWRMRRTGWWRQRPFLPLPDPAYWHFRLVTANGSAGPELRPRDVVEAARWVVRQPTVGR